MGPTRQISSTDGKDSALAGWPTVRPREPHGTSLAIVTTRGADSALEDHMETWGRRLVVDMKFPDAVSRALEEFQREGFEVSGQLDVRESVGRSVHEDFRRYVIITLWHPALGIQALHQSLEIGVELLVNVVVYELADEESVITAAEPLPSLSGDRLWREEWPALLPIEAEFDACVGRALGRMPRREATSVVM